MNRFLTQKDIAVFLGQSLADTGKALRGSRLRTVLRQGQSVYARDEVMNWMAENFSSLTTERLMKADVASADHGGLDPFTCGITSLLTGGRIFFPDRTSSRPAVLRCLSGRAVELGAVYDAGELMEQLEAREQVISTALKCGAALVHPFDISRLYIEHELLLLVRPPHPIPFGEPSGTLTSLFFLMLFPDPHRHVHILARINRLLRNDVFIRSLLSLDTTEEVLDAIEHRELEVISSSVKN